jgi:RHS repeat-associated protein
LIAVLSPFGLQHKGRNNVINGTENNYQTFQGQEDEKELSKSTYAYQWRDYDPAIARFNKIDRLAEKYHDDTPLPLVCN